MFTLTRIAVHQNQNTHSKLEMLKRAAIEGKNSFNGMLAEYLEAYSDALEDYRILIEKDDKEPFDERVVISIDSFLPYRDEFIDFLSFTARYRDDDRTYEVLHDFFESILKYKNKPRDITSWNEHWFDNYRFILHELFLYAIAVLIKNSRYEQANILLAQDYLYRPDNYREGMLVRYGIFRAYVTSLEKFRRQRLQLRHVSVTAHLIKQRANFPGCDFELLLQTDFILFLRDALSRKEEIYWGYSWYPILLPYAEYQPKFNMFVKAQSKSHFSNLKILLDVEDMTELIQRFQMAEGANRFRRHGDSYIGLQRIQQLANIDKLDTMA